MATSRVCLIPDCDKPAKSLNLCGKHYQSSRHLGVRVRTEAGKHKTCTIPKCDRPHRARGLCGTHHSLLLKYGRTHTILKRYPPKCQAPDCTEPHFSIGYCKRHALRMRRHGSLELKRRSRGTTKKFLDAVLASPKTDECILLPVAAKKYAKFFDQGKQITAHRYICTKAHGAPQEDRIFAAHSCGQSWCVNPEHIRWATPRENNDDKLAHGTLISGEKNYNAKLKTADVIKIRKMQNKSADEIALMFGVRGATIRDILRGRTWRRV